MSGHNFTVLNLSAENERALAGLLPAEDANVHFQDAYEILKKANDILDTVKPWAHGVEGLTSAGLAAAEYVNRGDTYDATVMWVANWPGSETGKFVIACWGDVIENHSTFEPERRKWDEYNQICEAVYHGS